MEPTAAGLIGTRKAVADILADVGVPVSDAERVVLAVSELATNAVQHGPDAAICVEVQVEGDEIELRVKQSAGRGAIPYPDSWRLPDDRSQICGRGLAIVAAVSDAVEVVVDGDIVEVVARFVPRSNSPTRTSD